MRRDAKGKQRGVLDPWRCPLFESPRPTGPSAAWDLLASSYPDKTLNLDQVYSLPLRLIESIWSAVPGFFNDEERQFERTLAKIAGHGFFQKTPLTYEFLPASDRETVCSEESQQLDRRHEEADTGIRQMLNDEMTAMGRSNEEIRDYWEQDRQLTEKINLRRRGYAGWLATNPDFHQCRDLFRERWEQRIADLRGFPTIPRSFAGESPSAPPEQDRGFYGDYMHFYQRWGLESFVTWDLPLPMRPELVSPSLYHLSSVQSAGMLLFVPWYLLRDKELNLHELAEQRGILSAPRNLGLWLDRQPKNWGHDRFGTMLDLYVWLELALKPRYAERIKGNLDRLDHAFAQFLCADPNDPDGPVKMAENIRRVRQEMQRRLAPSEDE